MTNRLAGVTSPYLQQHAGNPVDWYPWGEEALALARAEIRPILLSIGYSACHRCHVMAHESFEDEPVASATNALFVCAGSRFPGQWAPPILTCVVDAGMRDLFPSAPAWRERRSKAGLSPRKGDR